MTTINETELLSSTSGEAWADAFVERFDITGKVVRREDGEVVADGDEDVRDMMRAWFANAIETGRTAGEQPFVTHPGYRVYTRAVNFRYEAGKRVERLCLWLARRMPAQLRMWVVVDVTNTARELYPDPTGYAGPDGLGYRELYDGALRRRTRGG